MSTIRRRTIVRSHTVRNRTFDVERIEWANTDGLSFDVHDVATGRLLTWESLDDEPGRADIEALLDRLADELEAGMLDPYFHRLLRDAENHHGRGVHDADDDPG